MSSGTPTRNPDAPDMNTSFARTLVDELVRGGVTDAVVAPGSRSTPLALALVADDRLSVHVLLDERSAAGFALGAARASGRPSVLCCTSGTATAHFHWAVLEAHHGRVPLVVCTADRPPELVGVGAGQTIDQARLYGDTVRWFHDPGPPDDCNPAYADSRWRELGARAVIAATGSPRGAVHLNLPFREPLVPTGARLADTPGLADGAPWLAPRHVAKAADPATAIALADAMRAAPRGLLVAGWGAGVSPGTASRFAAAAGWPVLADPISGLREGATAISTYDALLRVDGFVESHRPDLVVRVGAPLTSKGAGEWLDHVGATWLLDCDGVWLDPTQVATERVTTDPEVLLAAVALDLESTGRQPERDLRWLREWTGADEAARAEIDAVCDAFERPFEGRVARDVVAALPDGATMVVASSMPVRDVEGFAVPRSGVTFLANRGVNGIDGFVSTVLGAAAGSGGAPVVGLLGDLCFLHDANGLLGARERALDATFVVVDNDGGGIFSFLPQGRPEVVDVASFEELFATPHGIDLAALAAVHGVPCEVIDTSGALVPAVRRAVRAGGVRMVLVRTDRTENVARHQVVWDAVRAAMAPE